MIDYLLKFIQEGDIPFTQKVAAVNLNVRIYI